MKKTTIIEVAKLLNQDSDDPETFFPWDDLHPTEQECLIRQARFLLRKANARKLAPIFNSAAEIGGYATRADRPIRQKRTECVK